jgi:hypothetical protein
MAFILAASNLHAQILWGTPQDYTGTDADIDTHGTFVAGVFENYSASSIVVDGMTFDQVSDSDISSPGAGGGDGSGSSATPYLQILDGCSYVNVTPAGDPSGVSQVSTFSLNHLTAGDVYQVQIWNVSSWAGHVTTEFSGATPVDLPGLDFVVGKFTATISGTQSFTMQGLPGGNYGEIDAIALRDLGAAPEPSTYAMLFAGIGALVLVVRLRRAA